MGGKKNIRVHMGGGRYMGDMLIAFFQDAIADILSNPLTKADDATADAALPRAMMNGTNPEDSQCWRNQGLESTVVASQAIISSPPFSQACCIPQPHNAGRTHVVDARLKPCRGLPGKYLLPVLFAGLQRPSAPSMRGREYALLMSARSLHKSMRVRWFAEGNAFMHNCLCE